MDNCTKLNRLKIIILFPYFSRISVLEAECHGLRQQLEELGLYTAMLERREAERVEVRSDEY